MRNESQKLVKYVNFIGKEFDTKEKADKSNHEIHIQVREEIGKCIVEFGKNKGVDKNATTLKIWELLSITPFCIEKILEKNIGYQNEQN